MASYNTDFNNRVKILNVKMVKNFKKCIVQNECIHVCL